MLKLKKKELQAFATDILVAAKVPRQIARVVSRYLVEADLCGYQTHGVSTIPTYLEEIKNGLICPEAKPKVIKNEKGILQIDGNKAFGHYTLDKVIRLIEKELRTQVICFSVIKNIPHIGRLGAYVENLTRYNCFSILTASYALDKYEAVVAPFGGIERQLGTNPIAIGVPSKTIPFIFDSSTSATSFFGIKEAQSAGTNLRSKVLLDSQGNLSDNPQDFFDGGAILPFGGYKGFGLSVALTLIAGLSGDCGINNEKFGGVVLFALKIDSLLPENDYKEGVEKFLFHLRETTPQINFSVRIPGDRLSKEKKYRQRNGIPISEKTWKELLKCYDAYKNT